MRTMIVATTLIIGLTGTVVAQDHKTHAIPADALQWGPAPPVLPEGRPDGRSCRGSWEAGAICCAAEDAFGLQIPAHQHPSAEAVTVISGDFRFGMGDKLDETQAQKLGPGGFVDLPANMNHYAFGGSGEVIVQINSEGPFGDKYVNPAETIRARRSEAS